MDNNLKRSGAATEESKRTVRGDDADLDAARADWQRQQLQRQMNKTIAQTLNKYRPPRVSKHPKGATKQTVEARKAKNRARRKAR